MDDGSRPEDAGKELPGQGVCGRGSHAGHTHACGALGRRLPLLGGLVYRVSQHVTDGYRVAGGYPPAGEERFEGLAALVGVAQIPDGSVPPDVHLGLLGRASALVLVHCPSDPVGPKPSGLRERAQPPAAPLPRRAPVAQAARPARRSGPRRAPRAPADALGVGAPARARSAAPRAPAAPPARAIFAAIAPRAPPSGATPPETAAWASPRRGGRGARLCPQKPAS